MDAVRRRWGRPAASSSRLATRQARRIQPCFRMSRRANLAPARDRLRMSRRDLRRLGEHQQWLAVVGNRRFVDHDTRKIGLRRQVVHNVEQHLFEYRAQATRAGLPRERLAGNRAQRRLPDLELDAFHAKHLVILLDQRILGLDQNLNQRRVVEFFQRGDDRQAADELWNQAELDQILGLGLPQQPAQVLAVVGTQHLGAEANPRFRGALANDLLQSIKRPAADEEDVGGVDLDELLVRMLAPPLRGHRRDRAFDQLEQRLLHALAGYVTGDRGVVALARNLVNFVDVDDTALSLVDVVIALQQELLDDVFDVLADIARLGQGRGVGNHEGDVKQACERLGQQRLTGAGGPDQQDVALGQLDIVLFDAGFEPLVMIVDCNRQYLFGQLLNNDVLVQDLTNFVRCRKLVLIGAGGVGGGAFFPNDVVTKLDAFIADEHRWPGNELPHLVLAFAAEGTVKKLVAGCFLGHSPASESD